MARRAGFPVVAHVKFIDPRASTQKLRCSPKGALRPWGCLVKKPRAIVELDPQLLPGSDVGQSFCVLVAVYDAAKGSNRRGRAIGFAGSVAMIMDAESEANCVIDGFSISYTKNSGRYWTTQDCLQQRYRSPHFAPKPNPDLLSN